MHRRLMPPQRTALSCGAARCETDAHRRGATRAGSGMPRILVRKMDCIRDAIARGAGAVHPRSRKRLLRLGGRRRGSRRPLSAVEQNGVLTRWACPSVHGLIAAT